MTAEEYKALAAELRRRALNEESPAFKAELEGAAQCYEWAANEVGQAEAMKANQAGIIQPLP